MMPRSTPKSPFKFYHKDVHMPEVFRKPLFEGELFYTPHARQAAETDPYGVVALPQYFKAAGAQLIEVETEKGIPVKQLWRQRLDDERDLVLAITKGGCVKTVWINLASDAHTTLHLDHYEKPKKK